MQKWEYLRAEFTGTFLRIVNNQYAGDTPYRDVREAGMDAILARLGNDGWEAVSDTGPGNTRFMLFKRPLTEPHPA